MIAKEQMDAVFADVAMKEAVRDRRLHKRKLYGTDDGVAALCDLIRSGGVFSQLMPEDPAAIGAYNVTIGILEDAGLLDEENLEEIVRSMLSLPVMPDREAKE